MNIAIRFPWIITAQDYHEFQDKAETIASLIATDAFPPATKKLKQIEILEIGFVDGSYQSIIYSPSLLGRTIKSWENEMDFVTPIVLEYLNDIYQKSPTKNKKPYIPLEKINETWINEWADMDGDFVDYYQKWSDEKQHAQILSHISVQGPPQPKKKM